LVNTKPLNHKELVKQMLQAFQKLGCNVIVKKYFLHTHLDYFAKHLQATGGDQDECFYQDIKATGKRQQGQ